MTGPLTLFLDFDGTLYAGDLPVQAYARRVAELLPVEDGVGVVAALRRLLENREVPGDPGTDLSVAEDGYQAVELLAAAAGLDDDAVAAAYRRSRSDAAASAFAIDAPEGLVEVLTELRAARPGGAGVHVVVVTNADATGVVEILEGTGLSPLIDEVLTDAGKPGCWPDLIAQALIRSGTSDRILAVGDRWSTDLADIAAAGGWTALVDRFGRADSPDVHAEVVAPDTSGVLAALAAAVASRSGSTPTAEVMR